MEQFYRDKNNIAIIGAGPAGIFCAIVLSDIFKESNINYKITIFEKDTPLKTLLPTGNGRCNITNSTNNIKEFASNYPRGEKFLYSIFSRFSNLDTIDYFKKLGIQTYAQNDGRVFPKSNSSKEVRNKLLDIIKKNPNIKIIKKEINFKNELKNFSSVIISAGSRNSKNIIKSYNHTLIPFRKALCPLVADNFIYPEGVSIKSLDGDFIFTNEGISGPLAFKISSLNAYKDFPYLITIRLFNPELLIEDSKKYTKKSIGTVVSKYIPKSLAKVIVKDFNKNISEISKNQLLKYSKLTLKIKSTGKKGEIVYAGGVDLNELDKNCKSRINNFLWFCGEILNIDGYCGGFNLQNCWSTAYIAAFDAAKSIIDNNSKNTEN